MWPKDLVRVMTSLTNALSAITGEFALQAELALHDTFGMLINAFNSAEEYRRIGEALKFGLLRVMLICGNHPSTSRVHMNVEFLLMHLLPPSLLYYPVVIRIEQAFLEIQDLLPTSRLAKGADWANFASLAGERLRILKALEAVKWRTSKACDNIEVWFSLRLLFRNYTDTLSVQ